MSEHTVKHRDDGPSRYFGPVRTGPGEEVAVDEETAEYLVDETGYFEYVDDAPAESEVEPPADGVEDFLDQWFEATYGDRVDAIEDGLADNHLDSIEDETQSETELDAIERRREELSGDE